jgi:hypothetical protein
MRKNDGVSYLSEAPVTGKKQWMQEPFGEGLAIHADPESCGLVRKGQAEALTEFWTSLRVPDL